MGYQSTGKYFDDFVIGEEFFTKSRTITEADLVNFCGLSGDYVMLHSSEEYAKTTIHKGRIAHGFLVISIASGLFSQLGLIDGTVLGLMGGEFKTLAPVRIGDTISVKVVILDKKETSKPNRGVITLQWIVTKQDGTVVSDVKNVAMMMRK